MHTSLRDLFHNLNPPRLMSWIDLTYRLTFNARLTSPNFSVRSAVVSKDPFFQIYQMFDLGQTFDQALREIGQRRLVNMDMSSIFCSIFTSLIFLLR